MQPKAKVVATPFRNRALAKRRTATFFASRVHVFGFSFTVVSHGVHAAFVEVVLFPVLDLQNLQSYLVPGSPNAAWVKPGRLQDGGGLGTYWNHALNNPTCPSIPIPRPQQGSLCVPCGFKFGP